MLFNPPVLVLKARQSVLFFFFPDGVCFVTVLFIFPFSKQTSLNKLFSFFMIWDVTGGAWGQGEQGAAWFGATFMFL